MNTSDETMCLNKKSFDNVYFFSEFIIFFQFHLWFFV